MSTKPILIYKLTPLQIAFVDRIAAKENGLLMDAMDYSEIIAYQELSNLGFVNMHAAKRRRISIVLTETGIQACHWLHFKEASRAALHNHRSLLSDLWQAIDYSFATFHQPPSMWCAEWDFGAGRY